MATDFEQDYYGRWPQNLSDGDEPQEISVSQMLDHGSISFGRFSVESLSWERKSVFAHDRRREELEKFNGLVAKKKAYFEERYRQMRALKAARESQQTELILDYGGGDGSNSSQSEDEKASKVVGPRDDGSANTISAPSEEQAKSEEVFELKSSHSGIHRGHKPDQESSFLSLSSSEDSLSNVDDQDKKYSCSSQFEPAKVDFSSQMRANAEESEANHSNTPESRKFLRKPKNLESNSEPGAVTNLSGLKKDSSRVNQPQLIKKSQDHRLSPNIKDSVTGARKATKLDVNRPSSKGTTNPLRQTFGKAENSHLTRSANVRKVDNSTRSSLIASKRLLVAARNERPNLATPRALSIAMEKRANLRGCEVKQDSRIPNKLTSSLCHVKGGRSVQDASSKKTTTTTSSIKNTREAESKSSRVSKDGQMKPSASDIRTSIRRTEQPLLVPKSRSVNLPARNKSDSTSVLAFQPTVAKGDKQRETVSVQKAQQFHSVRKQRQSIT